MSKIVLALSLIVLILLSVIGVGGYMYERENSILEQENISLTDTVDRMTSSLEMISRMRETENSTLQEMRQEISQLKQKQSKQIGEVKDVYRQEGIVDHPLPDSLRRVLNDACETINGSPCPSP